MINLMLENGKVFMGQRPSKNGGADWDTISTLVRYNLGFCQIISFWYIFFEIVVHSFCFFFFFFSHFAEVPKSVYNSRKLVMYLTLLLNAVMVKKKKKRFVIVVN